jgi:NAD(P)-dependent dehydrogenase (short-subunit alcohol dehydrogenase family)
MQMNPSRNVVLITGCSSGIGRALALEWARRGHRVFATARRPDGIEGLDVPNVERLRLDVTDAASIAEAVAEVIRRAGQIDVLVNNAGYGLMGPALVDTPEDLRRQMETNVVGVLAMTQAVAPHMLRAGHGLIVNVGSASGILTTPFAGAYCASKAAVHALTDAMRLELEPLGLTVVSLQPGAIRSSFSDTAMQIVGTMSLADSPYGPIREFIERRATTSQDGAMDVDVFARKVVDALSRRRPPRILRFGRHSVMMPLMRWLLPIRMTDRILSRRFGLDRLT